MVSIMIAATILMAEIPYEQEEASLNGLIQSPLDKGACLSYTYTSCCTTKNGSYTVLHPFFGTFTIKNIGNERFDYLIEEKAPFETNRSGVQGLNGNIVKYFISNLTFNASIIDYGSLAIRQTTTRLSAFSQYCNTITKQHFDIFNNESALISYYVPLNVNNSSIEKNPGRYTQLVVFYPSIIEFMNSGNREILNQMYIQGGNFSFANSFLGTKNRVMCGFDISLVKTNIRLKLVAINYLIEYMNYMQILWILGTIFLVLTVRQVRKRIRKERFKS